MSRLFTFLIPFIAFQLAFGQTAADLPLAKDLAHLGDVRADLAKTVGKPVFSGPSSDLYFTGKYFVWTDFKMHLISDITYVRVTDSALFIAALKSRDKNAVESLKVVLTAKEIDVLLEQHAIDSNGAKQSWKRLKEGRWERSDGAKAATNGGGKELIVATKDVWPNLILDPEK